LDSFNTIDLVTAPFDTSYIAYDGCKLNIIIKIISFLNYKTLKSDLFSIISILARESRIVTFTLSTNPIAKKLSYYIDYGDKSVIANAQPFNQPTTVSYVYAYSGIFNAKITIFNSAYSQTLTRQV
jgi:hypothetical protein